MIRFGVRRKITIGIGIIWLIGTLSMLTVYYGLFRVEKAVNRLSQTDLPASSAAYEMEINMNDVGMAVLKYLDTGDLEYRRLMEEEHAAFEGFHAEYLRLGKTEKEKELGRAIGVLYQQFKTLGEDLMNQKEREEAIFLTFID
ncbi:MAG: hypothetical protein WAO55_10385, partial [Candidatus Manganitrophaceae bacterium]